MGEGAGGVTLMTDNGVLVADSPDITTDEVSAVADAAAPLHTRASQVWIVAKVWHPTRLSHRVPVEVLVDTGAGGGNYTSLSFTKTVEGHLHEGRSIINSSGKGFLRAANPRDSDVSPMEVIGSCLIPLIFTPVYRVFRVPFRVVRDLPYAVVLGTAFMKENKSVLSFNENEGFKPTPDSTWVPFSPHIAGAAKSSKEVSAAWDDFCAVRPAEAQKLDHSSFPDDTPQPLLKANEETLDEIVASLRRNCESRKDRRRHRAALANFTYRARRKIRKRKRSEDQNTIAGAETVEPLHNQRPGPAPQATHRRSNR